MFFALSAFAVFYLAVIAMLTLGQSRLLYPAPSGPGVDVPGFESIAYETEDGLMIDAGYRSARSDKPTILYFHGNGADWQSSVSATDRMVLQGYGVLAAEYRGYRENPGAPSEKGFYRDGRAAIAFLAKRGVAAQDLVIIGNSIGSGVAVQMASEIEPRALVLISPFASLSQLVAEKIWWLPTGLLLRDRYENSRKLGEIDTPTLVLHGDTDSLIPHTHAERLVEANPDVELQIFPDYGHDLAWHETAKNAVLEFLATPAGEDENE